MLPVFLHFTLVLGQVGNFSGHPAVPGSTSDAAPHVLASEKRSFKEWSIVSKKQNQQEPTIALL